MLAEHRAARERSKGLPILPSRGPGRGALRSVHVSRIAASLPLLSSACQSVSQSRSQSVSRMKYVMTFYKMRGKSVILNLRLLVVCWESGFNGKQSKTQRNSPIDLPKSKKNSGRSGSFLGCFDFFLFTPCSSQQKWCEIGGPTGGLSRDLLQIRCVKC